MKYSKRMLVLTAIALAALALAVQTGVKVSMDGKPLTQKGRVIDGQLYLPAADVAKALGMTVDFKKGDLVASLNTAGGRNAADGPVGKPDEWLFNGKSRLMLKSGFEQSGEFRVYTLEMRNADAKPKQIQFGFIPPTQLLLVDGDSQYEGALFDRDKDYAPNVQPGTAYLVKWKFKCPAEFKPKRLVVRIQTQISGNPPVVEVFRFELPE